MRIRIDVTQVLGRLRTTVDRNGLDRYLVACASVQFWADLLATSGPGRTTADMADTLRCAERAADRAAQALVASVAGAPGPTEGPALACIELGGDDSMLSSLGKVLHLPMPECCGYNLADLELITADVARLTEQVGVNRPVLIVGIRSGGTYLAPLWKAALTKLGVADASWCTVRPCSEKDAIDGLGTARVWIEGRLAPVVVVVDDQPDTGATMEHVAAMLHSPGVDQWFSCVGSLWRGPAARDAPICSPERVVRHRRDPCLWKCLLDDEHPRFLSRLGDAHRLPALPEGAHLQFRCPQGEARYGLGLPWLAWNHPLVLRGRRPLVNPRKTPVMVCGAHGEVLFHLRFVGEGVFGRAECERIQETYPNRQAWFIDGYAVTRHLGATRSFREHFHGASPSVRADLLVQTASWLTAMTRHAVAQTDAGAVPMALGPRWAATMQAMQVRCGPSLAMPERLRAYLERPVPWLGRTGRAIRSSLRYACADWHWQVDGNGRLHRFQLEANWGDVSFLELEVAAFALENRLSLNDARRLAALCEVAYSSVRESLSLAALTIAEARLQSVRTLADKGRIALCQDFLRLLMTFSDLAGVATH